LHHWKSKEASIFSLAFSPDGRSLATGGDKGLVQVWEVATGKERTRFTGHQGEIQALVYSPDGKRLISGAADTTLLVWDVTGNLLAERKPRVLTQNELSRLWEELVQADAARAYRAMTVLAAAPTQAPAYLHKQLRQQFRRDPDRIARLIADLNHEDFQRRERATKELGHIGDLAEVDLRAILARSPSAEVQRRVRSLLKQFEMQAPDPARLRIIRCLEVLGQIGTPEAREVLKDIAREAPAWRVRDHASASLRIAEGRSLPGP
jgi:hypothetical protein